MQEFVGKLTAMEENLNAVLCENGTLIAALDSDGMRPPLLQPLLT